MVGEKSQKIRELADKVEEVERLTEEQKEIENDLQRKEWLLEQPLVDHTSIVKDYAKEFKLSYTDASNILKNPIKEYTIEDKNIPDIIKDMRMFRRTLKGDTKINMTNSIDNLIDAYTDHLNKSVDSIEQYFKDQDIDIKLDKFTGKDFRN